MRGEGIDYLEQGPRKMDHKRLAARMKRLRQWFRQHGVDITLSLRNACPAI